MVWCLSFRKQRAASCPSARPGCANGKGVLRDPKRNEIDRPTGQFRLSFWVEAPWSALRGSAPKHSNEQRRAAIKPRVRRSRVLLAQRSVTRRSADPAGRKNGCSKGRGLLATIVLLVRCNSDAVIPGQLSIPPRSAKIPINSKAGRRDRIQPGAPPRGADSYPITPDGAERREIAEHRPLGDPRPVREADVIVQ